MRSKQTKLDKKTSLNEVVEWQFGGDKKYNFSTKWYFGLVVVFLALLALAIFLIKSWSFVVLLGVSLLALIVYIGRPARPIKYALSDEGVQIDNNRHSLDQFKAFGLISNRDGSHRVVLIPAKRFSPGLEIDFTEADGERIVDFLGARLPMKKIEANFIDNIVQRIGL